MYYGSLKEYFAAGKMKVYRNCVTSCEVEMCKISGVFWRLTKKRRNAQTEQHDCKVIAVATVWCTDRLVYLQPVRAGGVNLPYSFISSTSPAASRAGIRLTPLLLFWEMAFNTAELLLMWPRKTKVWRAEGDHKVSLTHFFGATKELQKN